MPRKELKAFRKNAKREIKDTKQRQRLQNKLDKTRGTNAARSIEAEKSKEYFGLPEYNNAAKSTFTKSQPAQAVAINKNTAPQQDILAQIYGLLTGNQVPGAPASGALGNIALPGNNQLSFDPIRQRAQGEFDTKIAPSIANQYLAMGSGNARPTDYSSYAQQLFNAGGDLQSKLAALESEYGLQKSDLESRNALALLGQRLNPEFDAGIIKAQDSDFRRLLTALLDKGADLGSDIGYAYFTGGLTPRNSNTKQPSPATGSNQSANPGSGFTDQNNPGVNAILRALTPALGGGKPGGVNDVLDSITRGYRNNIY